jgi:hypothetical protein
LAEIPCIRQKGARVRTGHGGRRGHTIQNLEVHELVD